MREGERERWRKGRQKNGDLVVFLRSCNSSIKCSVLFNLSSAWISHISLFPQFSAAELTFYIRVKIEDIRLPVFIFNLHTYTCIYTHSTSFSLIKLEERIFLCLKSFFFFLPQALNSYASSSSCAIRISHPFLSFSFFGSASLAIKYPLISPLKNESHSTPYFPFLLSFSAKKYQKSYLFLLTYISLCSTHCSTDSNLSFTPLLPSSFHKTVSWKNFLFTMSV